MGGRGASAFSGTGHAPRPLSAKIKISNIAAGALGGIGSGGGGSGGTPKFSIKDEITVKAYYDKDGNFIRLEVLKNGIPIMIIEYQWEPTLSTSTERVYHYHDLDANGNRSAPKLLTDGMMLQFGKYFKPRPPKN